MSAYKAHQKPVEPLLFFGPIDTSVLLPVYIYALQNICTGHGGMRLIGAVLFPDVCINLVKTFTMQCIRVSAQLLAWVFLFFLKERPEFFFYLWKNGKCISISLCSTVAPLLLDRWESRKSTCTYVVCTLEIESSDAVDEMWMQKSHTFQPVIYTRRFC